MKSWLELITGARAEKQHYREYRQRVSDLPPAYRAAVEAIERYLTYAGGITDGPTIVQLLSDLADLFEQAAAEQTPLRAVVGEDPVAFAEDFLSAYNSGDWRDKERNRLNRAIDAAERADQQ